jgi:hypothetical protein
VLVARWEFISAVTRRMYVFAVVAMPVIYGLMLTAGRRDRNHGRAK